MSLVDIIQIVIGTLSLIATIAVSFAIYWLQTRHEKDIEKKARVQEQKELEEKAKLFLMENEAERDYLPWCVIAANLHRLERHTRTIYTSFCRCPEELRNEIFKQAGFEIITIKGKMWVYDCIEKLKVDIKKYDLGQDYLYDGAKYFYRSYERYRELQWEGTPGVFEPINKDNSFRKSFNMSELSVAEYVDEYFYYYIDGHMEFEDAKPIPPMDYVWYSQNLASCEEEKVCMWLMELIESIAIEIKNRKSDDEINTNGLDYTDAQAETFEDKYYEVLQQLYNTYYISANVSKSKRREKRKKKEN